LRRRSTPSGRAQSGDEGCDDSSAVAFTNEEMAAFEAELEAQT
jgi:hypothetical protein